MSPTETDEQRIDRELQERLKTCKTQDQIDQATKEAEIQKKFALASTEAEFDEAEQELRDLRGEPRPKKHLI